MNEAEAAALAILEVTDPWTRVFSEFLQRRGWSFQDFKDYVNAKKFGKPPAESAKKQTPPAHERGLL